MRQPYDRMINHTKNPSTKNEALRIDREIQELYEDISELRSWTGESQLLSRKIKRLRELTERQLDIT